MSQPLTPAGALLQVTGMAAAAVTAIGTLQYHETARLAGRESAQLMAEQAARVARLPQQCAGRKLTPYEASLSTVLTPCGKVRMAQELRAYGNQLALNRAGR